MARYALVDVNDQIVREVDEKRLDPAAGVRDGFRWIPIVNSTVDLTTPGNSDTKSSSAEFIEPTQVRRVRTIVDMTTQEVGAQVDAVVDSWDTARRDELYALAIYCRDLTALCYELVNLVKVANGGTLPTVDPGDRIPLATFANAMDTYKLLIPMSAFKSRVKGNLS